jgi:TaqI-like C-terminal specificity domain/Eco57I restriction-modification methylase
LPLCGHHLSILQNDAQNPSLTDFERAFNVEVVTREFFEKYKQLYISVKESLDTLAADNESVNKEFIDRQLDSVNFAKKLLGQIVFLYFLQKKGWFGVGREQEWGKGPKDFLRRLFEKKTVPYQNFFNDILEPLFYEALAKDRRDSDNYYRLFNSKIPFLNGGLFDPINDYNWVHVDILLPNELFSNTEKTKEGDTGTGILDVFDRYNFTVKEDEPLDKEVAVDPEMLGKVFENLLEVKDRKSKGTYYTPREIVHYMCQESLINYLDTAVNSGEVDLVKEKPVNLKLFGAPTVQQQALKTEGHTNRVSREDIGALVHRGDLAIEHDAHVESQGKETRDYSYKLPPSIRFNATLIDDALAKIRVCDPAIGSGAFPVGMMTEVVRARNTLTTYLPTDLARTNYNFKRHAIQSCLYGVDIDPGAVEIAKLRLWLSLVVDEDDIKQIQPLPNLDYKIVCGNSLMGVERRLENWPLFAELEKLKPLYFEETNANKKREYKKQIDQLIMQLTDNKKTFDFDIYFSEIFHEKGGFDIVIANPPYGVKFSEQEKKLFLRTYFHQDYQLDSYLLFLEKAWLFLCKDGVLTFIIPNPWLTNLKTKKIRRYIFGNYSIQEINHYSRKVFDATVDTEVVVILKRPPESNSILIRITDSLLKSTSNIIPQNRWIFMNGEPVNIFLDNKQELLSQKIRGSYGSLGKVCKIAAGVEPYEQGRGSPPQTQEMINKRVYDATFQIDKTYRPVLRGRDIEKYLIKWDGKRWIKYGENLAAPRKLDNYMAKKKIVIRQTGDSLVAALDTSQFICLKNMHTINTNDSKYDLLFLLGLINSTLMNYYFQCLNPEKGEALAEVKKENVEKLPVVPASPEQQAPIIQLVEKLITVRKQDPESNSTVLERQLDQLVYELYNLTPDEIKIIEV